MLSRRDGSFLLGDGYSVETDILHHGPDNCQATRFSREAVNLIGTLPHIAEQTFDGIGALNVSVHGRRELVKRQEVLFIFAYTAHCFWVALTVLAFEGRQFCHGLLFCGLVPDASSFGCDEFVFPFGNGIHHIALFMHQTPLTRGSCKEGRNRSKKPLMSVSHDEIHFGDPACAQIL